MAFAQSNRARSIAPLIVSLTAELAELRVLAEGGRKNVDLVNKTLAGARWRAKLSAPPNFR